VSMAGGTTYPFSSLSAARRWEELGEGVAGVNWCAV